MLLRGVLSMQQHDGTHTRVHVFHLSLVSWLMSAAATFHSVLFWFRVRWRVVAVPVVVRQQRAMPTCVLLQFSRRMSESVTITVFCSFPSQHAPASTQPTAHRAMPTHA